MLKKGDLLSGVYEIIQEIGAGGTGVIYLGYHRRLQKQIVIKRIKDNYTGRINVRGEADILKKLHHRYLPQVYDFIVFGQDVYTVMDYIPGIVWFLAKTFFLIWILLWIKWTYPRLRIDQILKLEWKYLMPLSLLNLVIMTIVVALGWHF